MVAFELKKDEILMENGAFCQYMYFIKKGALMGVTRHKKKKIVTYISVENEFVSSISGLYGKIPSKEEITAIEDTYLIAIHNDDLQRLLLVHFDLNFLFRVMVEQYYRDAQERTHIVRVGNAKERYTYFTQTKPGYMERLPLEYIASLLDITPNTLIKIKKQYILLIERDKATEDLCKQVENYMIRTQAFKDHNINLNGMAAALGISPHKLSSLLNNYLQTSFKDFINNYRVNYIKEQLADPVILHKFTIESIAYNSGFASRSTFYNAFKKLTGDTPVEYLQRLATP